MTSLMLAMEWGFIAHEKGWNLEKARIEFEELMKDPEENIKYAYNLSKGSNWSQWSAYNNGTFNKFLNQ